MKCDELKAFDITVAEEGYCEGFVKYRRAVYDKSDADNVIKDLEESHKKEVGQLLMEITNLKERVHDCTQGRAITVQELRHQKYKRCLSMARWCNRMFSITFGKERYWQKWNRRWLSLAEEFKEAK